uniref:Skp1 domain-containing protein n=1 Tax=Panagrellus redivivus TaxID=6233 RepID=A0A7E4VDX9_PANRE
MASTIANLPETLKIRTSDNKVIEVTGKLINESYVVKELFEKKDDKNAIEITLPIKSFDLKSAVKALEMCDLETPHVPVTDPKGSRTLVQTHHNVMEFFESLQGDMISVSNVADVLECQRLKNLCLAFLAYQMVDLDTRGIRQRFGFRDDYTEEEEEAIRKAHEVLP